MKRKSSHITVKDQFCGAGGNSQAFRRLSIKMGGGIDVKIAMNHWKLAIQTHNTNFPETDHVCADISNSDPRRYPSTTILVTSPECTTHSPSGGGVHKKLSLQGDLFEKDNLSSEATERSRATMWDVIRYSEYHRYEIVIVENVVEAKTTWPLFDVWLSAMHKLGYLHKCVYRNSMHHWPTPQSRDRMYVIFWKKGNKAPDLDFYPLAYCQRCSSDVHSVQSWKRPDRQYGKYKTQYVYRCPSCTAEVSPYYYAAFNAIDWTIPTVRIGDRKKPLCAKTMARIQSGLDKYDGSVFQVSTRYSSGIECRVKPITDELATQPGDASHGIAIPMIIETSRGGDDKKHRETSFPIFTQTTTQSLGVLVPMLIGNYSPGWSRSSERTFGTVTTDDHHSLIGFPPMIVENFNVGTMRPLFERLGCVTAGGINYGLLTDAAMSSFIGSYNSGSLQNTHVSQALATVTTVDRAGLTMSKGIDINDCHYRMLVPDEVGRAMAFDDGYIVLGNNREKVKQYGNAVTPPVMEWLAERCVQSLM